MKVLSSDEGSVPIAIEIRQETYAPLISSQGHIVGLVNIIDGNLIDEHQLTMFGCDLNYNPYSPWRFCGKRHESMILGIIDFAFESAWDLQRAAFYIGCDGSEFDYNERNELTHHFNQMESDQKSSFEAGVKDLLAANEFDENYDTIRYRTTNGLQVASMVYGGIKGVQGLYSIGKNLYNSRKIVSALPKLSNVPTPQSSTKIWTHTKNETPNSISNLENNISKWLGKETKMIQNKSGDVVFISQDGARKIRFDFKNPAPHSNPHCHIEELIEGKWTKSGQIYPIDVPHH